MHISNSKQVTTDLFEIAPLCAFAVATELARLPGHPLPPNFHLRSTVEKERHANEMLAAVSQSTDRQCVTLIQQLASRGMIRRVRAIPEPSRELRPLTVIAAYFNPLGWESRRKNADVFVEAAIAQGAHVIVAEAVSRESLLADRSPEMVFGSGGSLQNLRFAYDDLLWHKERLINLAIQQTPADHDIAWVDADLLFDDWNWIAKTQEMLRTYPTGQLFSTIQFLGPHGTPIPWFQGDRTGFRKSIAHLDAGQRPGMGYAPGGAWAARRELLDDIGGLWDKHITGAGDMVWWSAVSGHPFSAHLSLASQHLQRSAAEWAARVREATGGHIGCVEGNVRHLWHGRRSDRQYESRHFQQRILAFDPEKHIEPNEDGLYRWTEDAPADLRADVARYFRDRNEDCRSAEQPRSQPPEQQQCEAD